MVSFIVRMRFAAEDRENVSDILRQLALASRQEPGCVSYVPHTAEDDPSMVVIYEIFARLSDSAKLSRRGWDQGYAVAVATAAGLCNFLRLSLDDTAHAVGIAATASLPLRVTRSGELTPWKNAATAFATRNGLFAAPGTAARYAKLSVHTVVAL